LTPQPDCRGTAALTIITAHPTWSALVLVLVLGLLAHGEPLTGTVQELLLLLAHLDRVNDVVGGDLLVRLASTDRLHGDHGLELGTMDAPLALWWDPLSGAVPRLRG